MGEDILEDLVIKIDVLPLSKYLSQKPTLNEQEYILVRNFDDGDVGIKCGDVFEFETQGLQMESLKECLENGYWGVKIEIFEHTDDGYSLIMNHKNISDKALWYLKESRLNYHSNIVSKNMILERNKQDVRVDLEKILSEDDLTKDEMSLLVDILKTDLNFKQMIKIIENHRKLFYEISDEFVDHIYTLT